MSLCSSGSGRVTPGGAPTTKDHFPTSARDPGSGRSPGPGLCAQTVFCDGANYRWETLRISMSLNIAANLRVTRTKVDGATSRRHSMIMQRTLILQHDTCWRGFTQAAQVSSSLHIS